MKIQNAAEKARFPKLPGSFRKSAVPSKASRIGFTMALLLCAALYVSGLAGALSSNLMRYLLQIFLYIVLGEAWNLLSGYAGMTSLGQQLFVGLSGYAVAVVTSLWGLPFSLGLLLGALLSAALAVLFSLLLFRMRGMYFAIATWVAAEAAQKLFQNWKYVGQGAGMTVRIVPYPDLSRLYVLALSLCLLAVLFVALLLRSRLGLGLVAMRDDPAAAASVGVPLLRSRLLVYVLSAVLTALAGGIFFINKGVVYPESGFSVSWTVSSVFICIIGGTGTLAGPAVGAVVYVLLQEFLAHYPGWSNIMLGLITILVIRFLPGGLISLPRLFRRLVRRRLPRR